VAKAIDRRDEEGLAGRISPVFSDPTNPILDWTKLVEKVEFDVAVTEARTGEASAGGGLEVFSVKVGGKGSVKQEQSSINRIRFSVPVLFPAQITHPTSERR
jgi:hypothetical protein